MGCSIAYLPEGVVTAASGGFKGALS